MKAVDLGKNPTPRTLTTALFTTAGRLERGISYANLPADVRRLGEDAHNLAETMPMTLPHSSTVGKKLILQAVSLTQIELVSAENSLHKENL